MQSQRLQRETNVSSIPIAERQLGAAAGQPGATTSPSWGGISRTLMVHGLFLAAVLALLPVAASKGLEITAITPAFASLVFVTELTTSFLLFVQFRATRTWSVLLLGCAYLFGGLMPLLHLLTFPGAILQNQIILGTPQSTAWAFLFWMSGYSILMLAAVIAELAAPDRKLAPANTNRAAACAVAAILATAAACALVSTAMTDRLPPPMAGAAWTGLNTAIIYTAMSMLAASVLLILLFIGRRNTLFLWLSCALTAVLAATILSHAGGGRYTVGWSVGRLSWALSAVVLLIFFLRQFARQQHALAQARQFLEQRVAERTTDLTRTVHERDLLLREVHHRVKNNLQVVDSLMNLETSRLDDAAAKEAFERLRRRVFTLGLAHQQLASSEDIRAFSIAPFLRDLLENLSVALSAREAGITFGVTAEPLPVNLDLAIPVGLIITELVSEAARAPRVRNVSVEFRQAGAGTALLAVDNDAAAPTFPDGHVSGVGTRIVTGLTRQLGGKMNIPGGQGGRVEILMPSMETT